MEQPAFRFEISPAGAGISVIVLGPKGAIFLRGEAPKFMIFLNAIRSTLDVYIALRPIQWKDWKAAGATPEVLEALRPLFEEQMEHMPVLKELDPLEG